MKTIHPGNRTIHSAHLCRTDSFLLTQLFQALQNFLSVTDPEHICIPRLSVLHNHAPPFPREPGFIISEEPCIINVRIDLLTWTKNIKQRLKGPWPVVQQYADVLERELNLSEPEQALRPGLTCDPDSHII